MSSEIYWDPYRKGGSFSKVEYHLNNIESVLESFEGTYPISSKLSCLSIGAMISDTPILYQSNKKAKGKRDEDTNCTIGVVNTKSLQSLSPEKVSRMWGTSLKNIIKTLDATSHQCIGQQAS